MKVTRDMYLEPAEIRLSFKKEIEQPNYEQLSITQINVYIKSEYGWDQLLYMNHLISFFRNIKLYANINVLLARTFFF